MAVVMSEKNIETIIIAYIATKRKDYEILLNFSEENFLNKKLRAIYKDLRDRAIRGLDFEPELVFLENGVKGDEVKKILEMKIAATAGTVEKFFAGVNKSRLIEKAVTNIQKNGSLREKERMLKELGEELEKTRSGVKLHDADACIDKYLNGVKESFARGGVEAISTGLQGLDEKIMGFKNSEYVLVAARPSMGKTSLVTKFFSNSIFDTTLDGVPVLFSLEMETEQIMGRIVAQRSEKMSLRNTIFAKDVALQDIEKEVEQMRGEKFYIEDFSEDSNLEITPETLDIKLSKIEKKEGKIKLIIIDYLQLMSAGRSNLGQNERMTLISSRIKGLGRKYKCPVIALSQLNRDLEKRVDKRPQMSDLRESGALEQDADIIMFVYRPDVYLEKELQEKVKMNPDDPGVIKQLEIIKNRSYSEAEIIIGKQRNGPTGIVNIMFNKKSANFTDFNDDLEDTLEKVFGSHELHESTAS